MRSNCFPNMKGGGRAERRAFVLPHCPHMVKVSTKDDKGLKKTFALRPFGLFRTSSFH